MKKKLKFDLQNFAFDPDNVTISSSKTGEIPAAAAKEIALEVAQGSAMMRLAKPVEMTKEIQPFNYMTGIGAYWVKETERIQTSKPTWVEAEMRAHKLAVIIPVSKETLLYSVTDFFAKVKPLVVEAFAKKFDSATFFGTGSPFTFNIVKSATDSGNVVNATANGYDDLNQVIGKIEDHDLAPNGWATVRSNKRFYRGVTDGNGHPLLTPGTTSKDVDSLIGMPVAYVNKDSYVKEQAQIILADWDRVFYSILRNLEYKILEESTLTTINDEDGNPINLAERDMLALRVIGSYGFMVVDDNSVALIKPAAANSGESGQEGNSNETQNLEAKIKQLEAENAKLKEEQESIELEDMTVNQLKAFAADNGIDLNGLKTKDEFVAKIIESLEDESLAE